MNVLIDREGCRVPAESGDVALALRQGCAHIRLIARTLVIGLRPHAVPRATLAGTCYVILDLQPDRCVLTTDDANAECWVFSDYQAALAKLGALVDRQAEKVAPRDSEMVGPARAAAVH